MTSPTVHGSPQDPLIYPDAPSPEGRIIECYKVTTNCSIPGCNHKECIPPPGCTTSTNSSGPTGGFTATSSNKEKKVLPSKVYQPLTTTSYPFGTATGFPTNLGVVALLSTPVGGYIYSEDEG